MVYNKIIFLTQIENNLKHKVYEILRAFRYLLLKPEFQVWNIYII